MLPLLAKGTQPRAMVFPRSLGFPAYSELVEACLSGNEAEALGSLKQDPMPTMHPPKLHLRAGYIVKLLLPIGWGQVSC